MTPRWRWGLINAHSLMGTCLIAQTSAEVMVVFRWIKTQWQFDMFRWDITCLTWLRCLEVQPGGERRRPHLVHTGDPHTVVGVTPHTGQDEEVRRNQNLLLREIPPPNGPPQHLRGRVIVYNFRISSLTECVWLCYLDDAGGQLRVTCKCWFPWQRDVVVHHPQDLEFDRSSRQH